MTRVSVDDQISQVSVESNQRLLDVLQTLLATLPPNRIVKEILVDGEAVPRHMQAHALECGLQDVQELQIRTADKAIWAVSGIDMCMQDVQRLLQSMIHVANLFREGDKPKANRFFAQCVEGMERFLETLLITRTAAQIDFNRVQIDGISLSKLENELSSILKNILVCQEASDMIGIADRVEYELIHNLDAWKRCLKQLKLSQSSNA